ncbi:hypothetical protein [Planococcus donghaensis]|uniref:hypothetical protein n=1 Tax=Planococcus donghaensis TaxID=414778 RepID=UPI00178C7053|nr:hypothetical protein [Planococcus donghaensis]
MWIFIVPIASLISLGALIEWKRKKRNDTSLNAINPHTRPGESSNYQMGDNHYTSGGD